MLDHGDRDYLADICGRERADDRRQNRDRNWQWDKYRQRASLAG